MGIFEQAQQRARKIAAEQEKRYEEIAQKLLDIIVKEKVTVVELPKIVLIMTGKVNQHIDKAEIEQILNLDEEGEK